MMSPTEFPVDRRITDRPSGSRPASGRFVRYLLALCIGVVATLAWQSYGEAIKTVIATSAPELGWSPESKQMIAGWIRQRGWAQRPPTAEIRSAGQTSQAASVAQSAPDAVAPKPVSDPAVNMDQVQHMARDLSALRQTVEQLAAGQDQMAREIEKLQAADLELLNRIPTAPRQVPAVPGRKPVPLPSSRAPIPPQ